MIVRESLNESMGYKTIFGSEVSHEEALQKSVRDFISNIVMDERGISEKAFGSVDAVMAEVKLVCEKHPEIYEEAQQYYESGKRLKFLAEQIYDKFIKNKDEDS